MSPFKVKETILKLDEGYLPVKNPYSLESPPYLFMDLKKPLICPKCGSDTTACQEIEDVKFVSCAECGCEFNSPRESSSNLLIKKIMERQRRYRRVLDIPVLNSMRGKYQNRFRKTIKTENKIMNSTVKQVLGISESAEESLVDYLVKRYASQHPDKSVPVEEFRHLIATDPEVRSKLHLDQDEPAVADLEADEPSVDDLDASEPTITEPLGDETPVDAPLDLDTDEREPGVTA